MRAKVDSTTLKFVAFSTVMIVVAAFLLLVFSDYRSGDTVRYRAIFDDASSLRSGDTVRIAGVRVGTVGDVDLDSDNQVHVAFDVDRDVGLPDDTGAAVRYLNLVGDRYLELTEGIGASTLQENSVIPASRTSPALDLDVLLGGLKPVIAGLQPDEVNALSSAILDVMQGQRGTVDALFESSGSLFSTLGDNVEVIDQLIDQLTKVMETLNSNRDRLGETIDRLGTVIDELSRQRDPIGDAIVALDNGTASVADLLTQARPNLSGTIDQLAALAPNLDHDKQKLDDSLQRAPDNFKKLVRTGVYGNFIQYYVCAVTVRVSDPSGQVVVLPWVEQTNGRCSD
ncbi:MCE family protein [Rhodococcus sp. NPDC058521]|uniref:MCE family protein n=1 Tax=Rhodococcus sp. NPDC058521 TaxID=3346536 RepID=UPI0036464F98